MALQYLLVIMVLTILSDYFKKAFDFIKSIDETFDTFTPRSRFDLTKIEDLKPKYVKHKLVY